MSGTATAKGVLQVLPGQAEAHPKLRGVEGGVVLASESESDVRGSPAGVRWWWGEGGWGEVVGGGGVG